MDRSGLMMGIHVTGTMRLKQTIYIAVYSQASNDRWEYNLSLKCPFTLLRYKSFFDPSPKRVTHHMPNKEDMGGLC